MLWGESLANTAVFATLAFLGVAEHSQMPMCWLDFELQGEKTNYRCFVLSLGAENTVNYGVCVFISKLVCRMLRKQCR